LIAIIIKKLPKRGCWVAAGAGAALTVNLSGDIRTPGEFALQYAMAAIWPDVPCCSACVSRAD